MGVEWQVEQLRFTWFFTKRPSALLDAQWKAVFDDEPATEFVQRFPQLNYRAEAQAPECLGRGWLTFNIDPKRMDVFYGGRELLRQVPVVRAPVAGLLEEQLVKMWGYLKQRDALFSTPVERLAIGFVALLKVADRSEGYKVLDDLLESVSLDPSSSSDFLYQINNPTALVVSGAKIKINRLTRWSVMRFDIPEVVLRKVEGIPVEPMRQGGEEYWVRLEADINTAVGEFEELLPSDLRDAFSSLLQVSQKLAAGEG